MANVKFCLFYVENFDRACVAAELTALIWLLPYAPMQNYPNTQMRKGNAAFVDK